MNLFRCVTQRPLRLAYHASSSWPGYVDMDMDMDMLIWRCHAMFARHEPPVIYVKIYDRNAVVNTPEQIDRYRSFFFYRYSRNSWL